MAVTICSHCGAGHADIHLPWRQRRVYDYIRRHPDAEVMEIMAYVYANDPSGGPNARNVIYVLVYKINRQIKSFGLRIVGYKHRGYRLERIGST